MARFGKRLALLVMLASLMLLSAANSLGGQPGAPVSDNCLRAIAKQTERGIEGHGSKEGATAPINCDHAFNGD